MDQTHSPPQQINYQRVVPRNRILFTGTTAIVAGVLIIDQ